MLSVILRWLVKHVTLPGHLKRFKEATISEKRKRKIGEISRKG